MMEETPTKFWGSLFFIGFFLVPVDAKVFIVGSTTTALLVDSKPTRACFSGFTRRKEGFHVLVKNMKNTGVRHGWKMNQSIEDVLRYFSLMNWEFFRACFSYKNPEMISWTPVGNWKKTNLVVNMFHHVSWYKKKKRRPCKRWVPKSISYVGLELIIAPLLSTGEKSSTPRRFPCFTCQLTNLLTCEFAYNLGAQTPVISEVFISSIF